MGVALVAGGIGLGQSAWAQPSALLPSPVGAARMPEPVPCTGPVPNLVPGPISPEAAPPGPCPDLSLPANHNNAFPCETYPPEFACYFNVGASGLERWYLGKGAIAVFDQGNMANGITPPGSSPLAQRFSDITQHMEFGPRATLGLICGCSSFEITGFYIPQNYEANDTMAGRGLDTLFFNAPPGFHGANGTTNIFVDSDRVKSSLTSELRNIEINYKYNNPAVVQAEFLCGVRLLDLREKLQIFNDHDSFSLATDDSLGQATYTATTHNTILAPQLGFECGQTLCTGVAFGFNGKAAWGANYRRVDYSLVRGDGFTGFQALRSGVIFSQLYELGAFLDVSYLERVRVRAGYNAMWLLQVASVEDQVDFNLGNPRGRANNNGSIFYHGPLIEIEFLF
jgi:hypothetical protein